MSVHFDPSALRNGANAAAAAREDMRIGGEPAVRAPGVGAPGASGTTEPSFGAVLEKTVVAASAKAREAEAKAESLAQGRSDDLHGTMITMKEADISLRLVGAVRDKLLDAFHELWRINV